MSKRSLQRYRYHAFQVDRSGAPIHGVEEDFVTRDPSAVRRLAWSRAVKQLDVRIGTIWMREITGPLQPLSLPQEQSNG